ncbi:class A beta-lactamase-related serine hydrolase [Alteraurantiacibacter aquimixticola]|uniref:Class A beta-lactamase-related serine hydrolase n=2 Tax=Alteraurantiacibacter aquimixticola TaxID=2489173 RepID=A0A4T3F3A3_9SPHN|nr:class A beta-lactamase-related serine hydrolase [Alteraurantiacibacter aquimixticola]
MLSMPMALRAQGAASAHPDWPGVSRFISGFVDSGQVANMVATLGYGEAEAAVLARGTTSFTSSTSADADTLYRIYSMTKPVTGMATVICIDDGLISLDQPIAEILPAFAKMQVQREYDGAITPGNLEPAVRPITIRHCLTHTAGLGYSIVQQGPISTAYAEAGLVPGQVTRLDVPGALNGKPVNSLELFADRLATMPLVYQPGTKWSYSVGLDLLGRVIEVVTGKSFDAFLKERIFDPVGMSSTWFRVPHEEAHRLTANYFLADGTLLPVDLPDSSIYLDEPPFPFGGAGLVSSSRDYDRFLQMIANYGEIDGVRVMSEPAVRLATSDLFADTVPYEGRFQFGERPLGYGAGGLVGSGDAAGLFGWFGAAGTCGLVNMRRSLRHNLMTQYMPSTAYPVQNEFPVVVEVDALAQDARG